MNIGIDLRPLQLHFRYRGIGVHITELLKSLPDLLTDQDRLFIYIYNNDKKVLSAIPPTLKYKIILLPKPHPPGKSWLPFFIKEGALKLRVIYKPIPVEYFVCCDVWLGFDFMLGFPEIGEKFKVVYVIYDLIPLIHKKEYFPSFFKILFRRNFNEACRDTITKYLYIWAVRHLVKRSDLVLPISYSSLRQLKKIVPVPSTNKVIYLGSPRNVKVSYKAKSNSYKDKKFIFYIGGGDPRRKIEDLVYAFNKLKQSEPNLLLLLAGNDFRNLTSIPSKKIATSIRKSDFRQDIKLLGFIKDDEKRWFYKNAVCFAFPSTIEGFGLPLLEAMQEGCPVVAYSSELSSTAEVTMGAALLVNENRELLYKSILSILSDNNLRESLRKESKKIPSQFSWEKNARETIGVLRALVNKSP